MKKVGLWLFVMGLWFAFALAMFSMTGPASPHDIYTGVTGKDGQLCCGAEDCFRTTYAERKAHFFFHLKPEDGGAELDIPADMITWMPVVGDTADGPANKAHLCYRRYQASDDLNQNFAKRRVGDFLVYCAFIPPGST